MLTKLRVLMFVDFMASSMGSTEDEYNEIRGYVTEMLPECELSFQDEFFMHKFKEIKDTDWDIFVLDWGGVMPGCEGLTDSIYEHLVSLTYEHPDKLFILWSAFTKRYYLDAVGVKESKRLLHEELEKLIAPNVVPWFDDNSRKRCRLFFGLPEAIDPKDEKPYLKYGKPTELVTPRMRPTIGADDDGVL